MRVLPVFAVAVSVVVLAMTLTERPVSTHPRITTNIIFKKEVAQIFQRKCFTCHSENNLAMSLTTYELARPWARAIREEILDRRMPPWGAVAGFGHFSNDASLTQREMEIILSWADGGAPSGVLKAEESVPPVFVPPQPIWEAGPPDEVIAIPQPVTIEPGSGNQVKRFELKAAFSSPRTVKALAFKPGDRRVVRYAALYESKTGRWLWTWTPWHTALKLPDDVAYRLAAHVPLTLEIGYRSTDEAAKDSSELGLYFGEGTTKDATALVVSATTPVEVKADSSAQKVKAEAAVTAAGRALAIWPELGDGATSFELSAVAADGVREPLVWVKDVRPDWPTGYVFRSPVALARGTRVVMTAYYKGEGDKPHTVKPTVTIVTAP